MGSSLHRMSGLTFREKEKTYDGYTLLTPIGGSKVILLNMNGMIVHSWAFDDILPGYGRLLQNGNLLLRGVERALWDEDSLCWVDGDEIDLVRNDVAKSLDVRVRELGANASLIQEVDWDGNVVWEYKNKRIHHDFVRLSNGNNVLVEWAELPQNIESLVVGGLPKSHGDSLPMLGDEIFEIDPEGNELWRVKLWELHDPVNDPICPLEDRQEWTHLNGLDIDTNGDILFSCRNNSRVGIIEKDTKKLIWNYGQPNVFHQHHATYLDNGNIQMFDNGMHRSGVPRSRVIEVNRITDEVVWEYKGNPEIQFFSGHISGADRLPNGNVLICEGATGRLFEVTQDGETVWQWVNPILNRVRGAPSYSIFRAHRYEPSHPGLKGRTLELEKGNSKLNALYGL